MIIVADSGSTKTDWRLIASNGEQLETKTIGFNPFFHTQEFIANILQENILLKEHSLSITHAYYYGAACSSPDRKKIIENALRSSFSKLQTVSVDHDLTAAAIATAGNSEGITCILGTGSNACYWDGKEAHQHHPSLGYILGDEGSGTYFGKKLLADWMYKRMPEELQSSFGEVHALSNESIFNAVYNQKNTNVYLAHFMKFVTQNKEHAYLKKLVYEGMARFVSTHVWCYPNFREVPVHFVGSIAFYFKEQLELVARNHNFTLGKVEQKPIVSLAKFHSNNGIGEHEF